MRTQVKATAFKLARLIGNEPRRLWARYAFVMAASVVMLCLTHFFARDVGGDRSSAAPMLTQTTLVSATVLILIAEAVFVFLPAIFALQQKDLALMRSKRRLLLLSKARKQSESLNQQTGLPNRKSLEAFLDEIGRERRKSECHLYVVGMDDFRSVNELVGHQAGDQLLRSLGQSLKSHLDYDDFIAHIDSDQFVIVSDKPKRVILLAIERALDKRFEAERRHILVKASVGHTLINPNATERMRVLSDAMIALQFAKRAGGACIKEFSEELRDELGAIKKLHLELHDAIKNGEIEPWFQPQMRLSDGQLHGAEVLARWRHPTRGVLTPDAFLPAAENAGLMIELDLAIWSAAMAQAKRWNTDKLWRPVISLNAAPETISDPHLIERFLNTLQQSGLDADQVVVEVLETTLINGKDDMAAINIDSLAECGIALELDDFGTGYASLSKLTQLPLSGIKLDRSLITPLPNQGADSVVRAILALAMELGLSVIAEGVEETAQAEHLNACGCHIGQGYGFGKPMAPQDFTRWLSRNAPDGSKPVSEVA